MKFQLFILTCIIALSCNQKKIRKLKTDNDNYLKAKVFRDSNVKDSAFYYYNLAKNDYLKTNDSFGAAKSLINMALIQAEFGDYFGGIETSFEADRLLKKNFDSATKSLLATNYNNIAYSSHYLNHEQDALKYYFKALEYIDPQDDNKYLCYNNIADVLINQGKYNEAKRYLEKALNTKKINDYSKALNNLAKANYLNNSNYNPLPELYRALEIRVENNDYEGQNASFETLSEYFIKRDKRRALFFAKKMFEVAKANKITTDEALALRKIIELDPENYLMNFRHYIAINSRIQMKRNGSKNQFAMVRYDVEQKDAQNQQLKLRDSENKINLLYKNIGLGALSILLIIGVVWYKKRKKRLQQEKELEVKNTQLRLSKKVHDVVANGIYQVMTKIENQEHFDRDTALDELEFVYEKSRDISYDKADEEQEFSKKISELIASFNNDTVKTFTAGNNPALWENISPPVKDEVFQIIRELMVNMKKHSQASHVAFRFEKTEASVEIQYKDNGIGIPGDLIYKNGLRNAESRMAAIGGAIIFDTEIEKGLKVNLSVPAS
ncbi:tetratricopeptide repeat-containing sensor histidine kinase [Chryseobacterium camelliae]|uniref:tetratricopeptide repeat-containing sensor histidine kinase n=1 Tax=Chryseobacterium camelliae TaxID=1265445 RepID=UPI0028581533|nr:ATP-binding protein [Chryseobacterium camelliae]MDR6514858.1 signal transduction histidine kinase [Chryseobacterium camelliae]